MNRAEFKNFIQGVFDSEILPTMEAGQKEYAHDSADAFANFGRIAQDMEISPVKVLWIYAMKHRDGIAAWINGHESQREDVTGRIMDLIVYLFILWAMVERSRQ